MRRRSPERTATKLLKIVRPLAITAAAVNTAGMFLGAITTDPRAFAIGLIGAGSSTYGWLFFTEEAEAMEGTRYRDVAAWLRWEIKEETYLQPGQRLPSIREIAAKRGVSRRVVSQAMHLLQMENLIEVHSGRGCYVAGGHHQDRPRDRVENYLRTNSRQGAYLPAVEHLAQECEVSPATVRRVIAGHLRRGLLTKNRARFYYK